MKAYSYRRVSSKPQAKEGRGGLKRQEESTGGVDAVAFCADRGWTLDDTLKLEDKGLSAFTGANVELGKLGEFLRRIESKKTEDRIETPCALLLDDLSRLCRQPVGDAVFGIFSRLIMGGVHVVSFKPERVYNRKAMNDNPHVIYELVALLQMAHEASKQKSYFASKDWEFRRSKAKEKPMSKAHPQWLIWDDKKGTFTKHADRAAVVERIFALAVEDELGSFKIAKTLNKEGVAPFNGRSWTSARISQILRSESVIGVFQPKKKVGKKRVDAGAKVIDYYPRIVSDEMFLRAAGKVNGRKKAKLRGRAHGTSNLFTNLVFDAETGSPMRRRATTEGKGDPVLIAHASMIGQKKTAGFNYNIFEESCLIFLKDRLTLKPTNRSHFTKRREALEGELSALEIRMKRTQGTLATVDDADQYAALAEVLKSQVEGKRRLLAELAEVRAQESQDPMKDLEAARSVIVAYLESQQAKELAEAVSTGTGKPIDPEDKAALWDDLRHQLKNRLRSLLAEVWVLVKPEGWRRKTAFVEFHFRGDGIKTLAIHLSPGRGIENAEAPSLDLKHYQSKLEKLTRDRAEA